MVAMPRTTVAGGAPPQATTDTAARPAATAAASKRSSNCTFVWDGPKVWKSLRASPTNSSTLPSPVGAEARPRTVT